MTDANVKSYVDRGVSMTRLRKEMGNDLADLYKEAASAGFDKVALKEAIAIASDHDAAKKYREKSDRADTVALYLNASGVL